MRKMYRGVIQEWDLLHGLIGYQARGFLDEGRTHGVITSPVVSCSEPEPIPGSLVETKDSLYILGRPWKLSRAA